jgi:uncharacterized protein (DUF2252 family)
MHADTNAILDYNRGRDPERIALKLAALRADPFAFFRGTCPMFYRTLALPSSLKASPRILACGDLHLENFGSYKGDNRLVYFDLVDFDESCVAPVACELVRFLASILIAAEPLKIADANASEMVDQFIETYAANVMAAKPRWIERSLATGPVKKLLQSVKSRHRCDQIKERTVRKAGKTRFVIDGKKTLLASPQDRARAESILAAYASTQQSPAFFAPVDIARRISGNGSLGVERYVALVRGKGSVDGQYLVDIKFATGSALAENIGLAQPHWKSEAERVVSIQRISQAISPELLGSVGMGKRSYVIKELQPTADRVNLAALGGKSGPLNDVIRTMAGTTAWAHLRTCGRHEAGAVEALADFAARAEWRKQIAHCAVAAKAMALQQWRNYSADYDADPDKLRIT